MSSQTVWLLFTALALCAVTISAEKFEEDALARFKSGRYAAWYYRLKRSLSEEENGGDNNTEQHSSHEERYKVATINWRRVENPFVVCLWILFAGLAKIGFRAHYMHKIVSRVPESCLLICLGLIVGGIAYAINPDHQIDKLLFNPDTFFLFILPPIVLEAGYFMPKVPFFDNIGTILVYAIVGTLFNAFAIGLSLYLVFTVGGMPGMEDPGLTLLQCLLFGSIISAVDPVAVISVFEEIHVNIVLSICVFGESLLNDGVAVVLYHLFEQYIELPEIIAIDYVYAFLSFFVVVCGGLFIGIIYGFFGAFITKYTVHNRVIEPTFVFVTCYLSYLTAEIFHLSGIIAIVFAGFTISAYVEHNISEKSHTTVKYGMKMLANMCETIIFMLLGIAAVSDFWQHWNTGFVLWTLVFITIYRAIGVLGLTFMLNKFRLDKINGVDQFVMAYGGLRGAIAFSLVSLTSPEVVPAIKTMICACIVCILFTSFVQGSTVRPIVEYLHVKTATEHKVSMFEDINMRLIDHLMAGIEDCIGHRGHHYWTQRLMKIHHLYLMKWFVREPFKSHDLLETFHKINKREAQDMLLEIERGGSYSELTSDKTLANLILPHEMRTSYSTNSFNSILRSTSEACLDIRAIDIQRQTGGDMLRDEKLGDAHHLLRANMYNPRSRADINYRRGEIDVSHSQKRQEQEILIRRRIHQRRKKSQKRKTRHGRNSSSAHIHRGKNGSYITTPTDNKMPNRHSTVRFSVDLEPLCILEQKTDPLTGRVAPALMVEECHESSSVTAPVIEEDEGITFSVKKDDDEPDSKLKSSSAEKLSDGDANSDTSPEDFKPVALDQELPWRTANPTVAICDPRERRGSQHPHYYEESDDDDDEANSDKPGTSSLNTNNSNTKRFEDDVFVPKPSSNNESRSQPSSTHVYHRPDLNENSSIPLLERLVSEREILETLKEDYV